MKFLKKFVCLLLALTAVTLSLTSCGEKDRCKYYKTRNTDGRDISYAEIKVKDYGKIVVLLDATTAPVTVANFKMLVSQGFYNGLTFHRIIKDFMIQGGDPNANGTGGNTDAEGKEINIKGEFSSNGHANDISHIRGVISMARESSNDSASSQFFICNADSPHLDGNYAAFGYVVKGMKVVDKITKKHAKYASDGNGGIKVKGLQPVIESIVLLDSFD